MRTIKVNIKGDKITSLRAQAECGSGYAAITDEKQFNHLKAASGCIKVILVSKGWNDKKVQKTYYCLPV